MYFSSLDLSNSLNIIAIRACVRACVRSVAMEFWKEEIHRYSYDSYPKLFKRGCLSSKVRKDAGKTFHIIVRNLVGFLKSGVHEVFLFSHKRFSDAWNPAAVVITLVAAQKAATRWWCLFFCPGRCAELGAVRKHSLADCCFPYFPWLAGLCVTAPAAPGVVTIILVSCKVCFVVLDSNLLLVCMLQTDTKQHFFSSIEDGATWRTAPA